jgi:hypothetical protein
MNSIETASTMPRGLLIYLAFSRCVGLLLSIALRRKLTIAL